MLRSCPPTLKPSLRENTVYQTSLWSCAYVTQAPSSNCSCSVAPYHRIKAERVSDELIGGVVKSVAPYESFTRGTKTAICFRFRGDVRSESSNAVATTCPCTCLKKLVRLGFGLASTSIIG